ncbi:MAG: hypothetical protein IT249_07250 [Chitinophagaceae bacterium]|nr:hypothetical protein [Chitinophagaceae bacterium]
MNSKSLSKKIGTCFIAGLTTIALLLVLGNSGTLTWFPPVIVFSLVGLSFLSSLIFPFIWQRHENNQKINSEKIYAIVYGIIRYTIAFNLASFGWKKLLGLQFVVPNEISDKPMNQQSGEWLTWFYFGHSFAFGVILSIIQIGGSYLLLFRRTLLLGATILFAFMLNLTLINIFYQMNAGALLQSIILAIGIAFLILLDYHRLVDFFLKAKSSLPTLIFSNSTKNIFRLSAILLSLAFTIYLKSLMK